MTAALLDRPTRATEPSPTAPADPPRPRAHLLPQLLPVPDSEPPLVALPGPDEAAVDPYVGIPARDHGATGLFAGTGSGSALLPPAPIGAAPTIAHRRWCGVVSTPAGPRPGRAADTPHRVHSAVGILAPGTDGTAGIAPADAPPHRSRPAASDAAVILIRATIEALSGQRPFTQLRPHYTAGVFDGLQDFPMLGHRRNAQLVSVWVCEPTDGTAEVSAAFRCGQYVRAMAMQLRAAHDRWLVTSLQVG
jgi:hypothetical protein